MTINKSLLITIFLLTISIYSYPQTECDCTDLLNQVVNKIETEYPGFSDKTNDSYAYNNFSNALKDSAKTATGLNCKYLLQKYCSYFRDGHLALNMKIEIDKSKDKSLIEVIDYDISKFKKYLSKKPSDIEGIWKTDGYTVGIKKQNDEYIGFVIDSENKSWKEREIKFKLLIDNKAIYFKGNHSQVDEIFQVYKNCAIYFEGIGVSFVKEFPEPIVPKDSISEYLNKIEGFYVNPLSKKTSLLRIASFDYSYVDRINELILSNKSLLSSSENLIIDLRGNGGGTDYAYKCLLPFLYTNPVRYLSGEYFVSQTLIDGLENWANNADTIKYANEIINVRKDIGRMKLNPGKFIPYSEDDQYGFSQQDTIYTYPRNVVILADKRCGSSTEKFMLDAKQSKKVKIFGTPSYGAIDYVSVREFKLDCPEYSLYMPTVRMMRLPDYPIDNIGIQPDIYLDKFIGDWVQYAKDYLEK